jgi:CBS domain-containing protein
MTTTTMKSWQELTAQDVMTREVLVVSESMTVEELARFLVDHEISGAPVVDSQGRPVGVISFADLARLASEGTEGEAPRGDAFRRWTLAEEEDFEDESWLSADDLEQLTVRGGETLQVADVMSTPVQTVSEGTPVPEIAALMSSGHFHRLLVVDDVRLVGIITSMDLLGLLAEG